MSSNRASLSQDRESDVHPLAARRQVSQARRAKICSSIFCNVSRSVRAGPLVTAPLTSPDLNTPEAFLGDGTGRATPPSLAVLFVKRTS